MRKENSKRVRNKILAIFVVFLLFSSSVGAISVTGVLGLIPWGSISGSLKSKLTNLKHTISHHGKAFLGAELEDKFERSRTLGYVILFGLVTWRITTDISENINSYILENPDPLQPGVNSAIYSFVHLLIPFYVLAIVSLGIYLLFLSASPKGRARAKSMFSKLVIGMILVSISPYLLSIFFNLSTGVTESILDQGKEEVTEAVDTYNGAMWGSFWLTVGAIYGINAPVSIVTHATGYSIGQIKKSHYSWGTKGMKGYQPVKVLGNLGKIIGKLKLHAKPDRTIPMLMLSVTLFIGVYGILAFRYLMVMLFTLLFPFTIFFLCFDPTKKLGGTLLEQLLLWTLIQEFYAITLVAIGTGMMMVPEELLIYGFGFPTVSTLPLLGRVFPFVCFFDLAACFTLMLGPIILFMLLRKLLPPL